MSDQRLPIENKDTESGSNADSAHGEAPLIRREEELTPE